MLAHWQLTVVEGGCFCNDVLLVLFLLLSSSSVVVMIFYPQGIKIRKEQKNGISTSFFLRLILFIVCPSPLMRLFCCVRSLTIGTCSLHHLLRHASNGQPNGPLADFFSLIRAWPLFFTLFPLFSFVASLFLCSVCSSNQRPLPFITPSATFLLFPPLLPCPPPSLSHSSIIPFTSFVATAPTNCTYLPAIPIS